jgi:uncharacterized protein YdhG (YjbR/CyaY superfamily)
MSNAGGYGCLVQSTATTVDAYIAEAPEERRAVLELLRRLCREELPGFDETMRYGMPGYERDGEVEIGFASQKRYVSLYVLRQAALRANLDRLVGLSVGKGCIRFRRADDVDEETVRALLSATAADDGEIC